MLGLIPGWGQAASLGLSALSWVWRHKTLAALFVAFGLLAWYRHEATSARAALHEAELGRDEAKATLAASTADAERWHGASDLRDAAIDRLNRTLAQQNAEMERLRFSLDQANSAADQAEAEAQDARARFDRRVLELEEEADAHPDQVVPLGPLVRSRAQRLWD